MKKVIVIIPIYKNDISLPQLYSLDRCIKILYKYDIALIAPRSLEINGILSDYAEKFIIYRFEDSFFYNIAGYNKLMLSKKFYETFNDYEYILIAQLDTLIFKDILYKFLDIEIDYVGAPWLNGMRLLSSNSDDIVHRVYRKIFDKIKYPTVYVGNGGLSLRRVERFLCVLKKYEKWIDKNIHNNEDVIFSTLGALYPDSINIAPLDVSLEFSFETDPQACYEKNGYKIPFGCHAWEKYDKIFINYLLELSDSNNRLWHHNNCDYI